jgi:hypothetical protein
MPSGFITICSILLFYHVPSLRLIASSYWWTFLLIAFSALLISLNMSFLIWRKKATTNIFLLSSWLILVMSFAIIYSLFFFLLLQIRVFCNNVKPCVCIYLSPYMFILSIFVYYLLRTKEIWSFSIVFIQINLTA